MRRPDHTKREDQTTRQTQEDAVGLVDDCLRDRIVMLAQRSSNASTNAGIFERIRPLANSARTSGSASPAIGSSIIARVDREQCDQFPARICRGPVIRTIPGSSTSSRIALTVWRSATAKPTVT